MSLMECDKAANSIHSARCEAIASSRMQPPARRSATLTAGTQDSVFRLRYAAGVAMAFVCSGLAPAMLMALIWHEAGLAPVVFAFTFLVALGHAILIGLPLFLICRLLGWINLVSCVVLGAFIGIVPAGILAYPTQLSEFNAGAWTNGVLTGPDGVIIAAIWVDYIKPLIYFGLLGAWGGFIFWAVLKCWGMFEGGGQDTSVNALTARFPPEPEGLQRASEFDKKIVTRSHLAGRAAAGTAQVSANANSSSGNMARTRFAMTCSIKQMLDPRHS